jgi:uncharacterized protein YndB with AHSA1/START domain
MPSLASPTADDGALTLELTRMLDAPREAVFKAWTDPTQLARWLGPSGIRPEIRHLDATPGGSYRIDMQGSSGSLGIVAGIYREIAPPERLVFTWIWEQDGPTHSSGHETVVTVILRAVGPRTELTLRHERFHNAQSRDSHGQGWTGSLDRLAAALSTQ